MLGTAITKVCDLEISSTGLRPADAAAAGFDAVVGDAQGTTSAGYWPTASAMTIRVVAERVGGRILGAQVVGGPGAGKRIDVFATAIWNEMTAGELAWADLAYAPAILRSLGPDPHSRPPRLPPGPPSRGMSPSWAAEPVAMGVGINQYKQYLEPNHPLSDSRS